MDSVLTPTINFLLSSALILGGIGIGNVQADPSTDLISLILGPLGGMVVLVLAAWYLIKRDKEKEVRIQEMQNLVIKAKDDEIERLHKQLHQK